MPRWRARRPLGLLGLLALAALLAFASAGCEDEPAPIPRSGGRTPTSGSGSSGPAVGDAATPGASADGAAVPGSGVCLNDCNCPQGQRCTQQRCTLSQPPRYCCDQAGCPPGELCTDATGLQGVCGNAVPCLTVCDCPQGQRCGTNFVCASAVTAAYCCTKPGCPAGSPCVDQASQPGVCGEP